MSRARPGAAVPSPWDVRPSAFPVEEATSEQLGYLVNYAVLAPSTHNTQPWLFRVRADALDLFADRTRSLPVCDPRGRELAISCGAALQFARLAARNFGREGRVELLPDPGNPDLLARLHLGMIWAPTAAEERRFRAIPQRRTNRTPFDTMVTPALEVERLAGLASHYGVRFEAVRDPGKRRRLAALVAEADAMLMESPAARRELARWVKPRRSPAADGMSAGSFGPFDWLSRAMAAVMRLADIGWATARMHERLALDAPWIGLLSTEEDDQRAWLRTGMALADIALELTADGLSASYLDQPIELAGLRRKLAAAMNVTGFPQMLMRIGRAVPVPPAARREARKVIGG